MTALAIEGAVLLGDANFADWVTSTSPRPGVDALQRPTGQGQRAGGAVCMTVRRAVFGQGVGGAHHDNLMFNEKGVPYASACLI